MNKGGVNRQRRTKTGKTQRTKKKNRGNTWHKTEQKRLYRERKKETGPREGAYRKKRT